MNSVALVTMAFFHPLPYFPLSPIGAFITFCKAVWEITSVKYMRWLLPLSFSKKTSKIRKLAPRCVIAKLFLICPWGLEGYWAFQTSNKPSPPRNAILQKPWGPSYTRVRICSTKLGPEGRTPGIWSYINMPDKSGIEFSCLSLPPMFLTYLAFNLWGPVLALLCHPLPQPELLHLPQLVSTWNWLVLWHSLWLPLGRAHLHMASLLSIWPFPRKLRSQVLLKVETKSWRLKLRVSQPAL